MKLESHHSAPLEVPFVMASFFAEVQIFIFRPKSMDYSPCFFYWSPKNVLRKVCLLKGNEKRNLMAFISVA